jgi:hypothetical protein
MSGRRRFCSNPGFSVISGGGEKKGLGISRLRRRIKKFIPSVQHRAIISGNNSGLGLFLIKVPKRGESSMRIGIVAAITAVLFATNALATDVNAPLAPGKPAGLKQAQERNVDDNTILYIVGGAAIIAGIAILASSGNGGNNNNGTTVASSGTP